MDDKLKVLLNNILSNAHDHPLGYDELRVVNAEDLRALSEWYKSQEQKSDVRCHFCGNHLNSKGFCTNSICTYAGWSQNVPSDILHQGLTTLDIFDNCSSMGLTIKIKDEELRVTNDLFECEDCGFTFDNDDSHRRNRHYYCNRCAKNHPPK
jgi:hypothetical protein